jgi:hypothetical protein
MNRLNTKESRLSAQKVQFESLLKNGYTQETYKGLEIFVLKGEKNLLKVFKGTAAKPICFYSYRNIDTLNHDIEQHKSNYDRTEAYKVECKTNKKKSTAANCAAAIREELKNVFPGVKFSVKSDNFSMGNSVHVSYIDGPTTDQVDQIIGKYQYGHFNGMEDIYEYSNSREDIPQAKYVSSHRKISDEVNALLLPQLTELIGEIDNSDWRNTPESILGRILRKTSVPVIFTIKGIERTEVTCGQFEDFYRVVFEGQEAPVTKKEVEEFEKVEVEPGKIQIIEYSEKAIAVIGDTKPIKEKLGKNGLGGKFNMHLSCGPGWIFPKSRLEEVQKALSAPEEKKETTLQDEIKKTVEFFADHDMKVIGQVSESTKEVARVQNVSLSQYNVKEYDSLKDITDAANNGDVISLLNLYNLTNKKTA